MGVIFHPSFSPSLMELNSNFVLDLPFRDLKLDAGSEVGCTLNHLSIHEAFKQSTALAYMLCLNLSKFNLCGIFIWLNPKPAVKVSERQ